MTILDFLPLFAGIGLFLYGMNLLAKAIENLAGAKLEQLLEKLTSNKWKGLALGTGVTAIIQSSAATTVTVVGFVNAGMMNLHENRTSFCMHRLRNAPQTGNLSVLPNAKLRLCELSLSCHAGGLLNNQSCAAVSQLPIMLHMLVVDITASVRPIVHNHRRHADAVAYHRIANRKCIRYLLFHRSSPYS